MSFKDSRLQRVLDAANIIPWEADPQTWQFTYVGSQVERMLGYPLDQWYEKDFWTSTIFPEDQEFAINFCETSSKTLSDFECEYRMIKADGDLIWLRDIVNVDIEDGVPQMLRGFMIDITAVKRSEENLRNHNDQLAESLAKRSKQLTSSIETGEQTQLALRESDDAKAHAIRSMERAEENYLAVIETINHGIEEIDTSGIITFANTAHHKQYEYDAGKLTGKSIFDFIAESSERKELRDYLKYLVKAQPTPTSYFGKRWTKSGKVLDVEVAWNYKRDSHERLIGFISIITDITERKRAEEALREAHEQLEVRVQDRTRELRAVNEVLKAQDKELRKNVESMHKLTGRLIVAQEDERRRIGRELHDGLTQNLAAMAIDAGRLEQAAEATEGRDQDGLHKIKEGLMELSENVHSLSRQLHPAIVEDLGVASALQSLCEEVQQNVGVQIDYEADAIPADIPNGHELCVYRVVQEALRNVVKHSRATRAQVHLRSKNGTLKFQVRDNGRGFNLDDAKNQIGLGLRSIEERVWFVGGTVRVETGPGDGTVISVSIPLT